jgi:hypothetical protein
VILDLVSQCPGDFRPCVNIEFHSYVKTKDNIVSKTKNAYGEGELGVKIAKKLTVLELWAFEC